MFMSKDGKAVMEMHDRVIASTMDMFVEQPDVRGIFSHYDEDGNPHIFSKNATELSIYGKTRKFDLVRLDIGDGSLDLHKDTSCSSNEPIWNDDDLSYLQEALKNFKKKRDKLQSKLKIYQTSIEVIEHEINKMNGVKY